MKGCKTANEIWKKLEETYESRGPMRKATLLNQLVSMKMAEADDAREHTRCFFDVVGRLQITRTRPREDLYKGKERCKHR